MATGFSLIRKAAGCNCYPKTQRTIRINFLRPDLISGVAGGWEASPTRIFRIARRQAPPGRWRAMDFEVKDPTTRSQMTVESGFSFLSLLLRPPFLKFSQKSTTSALRTTNKSVPPTISSTIRSSSRGKTVSTAGTLSVADPGGRRLKIGSPLISHPSVICVTFRNSHVTVGLRSRLAPKPMLSLLQSIPICILCQLHLKIPIRHLPLPQSLL